MTGDESTAASQRADDAHLFYRPGYDGGVVFAHGETFEDAVKDVYSTVEPEYSQWVATDRIEYVGTLVDVADIIRNGGMPEGHGERVPPTTVLDILGVPYQTEEDNGTTFINTPQSRHYTEEGDDAE